MASQDKPASTPPIPGQPVPTFRERYCKAHSISEDAFVEHCMRRSLYWHARALRGILNRLSRDFFSMDRDLIRAVGELRSRRFLVSELNDYSLDLQRTTLKRWLLLRVCGMRLQKKVHDVWG